MSLGVRAGKTTTGRPATRLLLARPGGEVDPVVQTTWRAVAGSAGGDLAPETVVAGIRVSPMASKQDKAMLAAIANDDLTPLREIADTETDPAAPLAGLLLGLRLANTDPVPATGLLTAAVHGGHAPWDSKFLKRYLPTLQVCVQLAPGVPAIIPADQEGVTLLLAEMLTTLGRHMDAVTLLTAQPLTPIVGLALAATYLVVGQNEAVVKLTDGLANHDDVTALCLVARGVALRASGRMDEAIAAFDSAIHARDRHPGMVAAALEERANLLAAMGDDLAAQADRERITLLENGTLPEALTLREVRAGPPPPNPDMPLMDLSAPTDADAMKAARTRVRRHIAMSGTPGTFGGRHHRTYQPEVEAMLGAAQFEAAESLLLGLLDAVEDEAEVDGVPIDATFYLTLADLYAHQGDRAEYLAVMERFDAAGERFGLMTDAGDLAEVVQAMDQHEAANAPEGPVTDLSSQHVG